MVIDGRLFDKANDRIIDTGNNCLLATGFEQAHYFIKSLHPIDIHEKHFFQSKDDCFVFTQISFETIYMGATIYITKLTFYRIYDDISLILHFAFSTGRDRCDHTFRKSIEPHIEIAVRES